MPAATTEQKVVTIQGGLEYQIEIGLWTADIEESICVECLKVARGYCISEIVEVRIATGEIVDDVYILEALGTLLGLHSEPRCEVDCSDPENVKKYDAEFESFSSKQGLADLEEAITLGLLDNELQQGEV